MDYLKDDSIKAFFFDLYGTLFVFNDFDKANSDWENIFHELAGVKYNLTKKDIERICREILESDVVKNSEEGLTTYETKIKTGLSKHGIEIQNEEVKKIAVLSLTEWQKNICLAEDALFVINEIKKHKKVALITNFDHSTHIKKILSSYFPDNIFDLVIISDEVNCKKPDPKIFEIAVDHFGILPGEAVYIGDNILDDIKGAFSAGINPVLISRNIKSNQVNHAEINNLNSKLPVFQKIKSLKELIFI